MKRQVNKLTDEVQFQIVQEYLNTSTTQKELKEKYNFRGNNNINYWMRKFGLSKLSEEQIELHQAIRITVLIKSVNKFQDDTSCGEKKYTNITLKTNLLESIILIISLLII